MEDLRTILSSHHSKSGKSTSESTKDMESDASATTSEIPDVFFDEVLVHYKLTRVEILLLMYFYRLTWCRTNLYKKFGISPLISYSDVATSLDISIEVLHQTVRRIEAFGFIETIRSGQYFVRKYFTEEIDKRFGQTYDHFL